MARFYLPRLKFRPEDNSDVNNIENKSNTLDDKYLSETITNAD